MLLIRVAWCVCAVAAGVGGDFVPLEQHLDWLEGALQGLLEWPLGYSPQDGEEFEYVVVGAGGGGVAAAARLALAGRRVLLVEAGREPPLLSMIPAGAMALLGSPVDWQYLTLPNNVSCLGSRGRQCRFSRGRMLGGSTSINYMMYVRGNRLDYELGLPGWSWADMEPYFLRAEGLLDLAALPASSRAFHNTTGPMSISFSTDPENKWHDTIVRGFESLGFPFNPDVNAESQIGVTRVITYTSGGVRTSTARGYLARADVRAALRVAKGTRCTGVLLDDDNVARGVTVLRNSGRRATVRATRGVVLAAGAVGTPQLLQLAGLGPAPLLRELGVPLRVELPVGESMSDHVLPLVFIAGERGLLELLGAAAAGGAGVLRYAADRSGPLASIGLTDITVFANTSCYDFEARRLLDLGPECELPSLQLINAYIDRGLVTIGASIMQQATLLNDDIIAQLAAVSARSGLIVASPVVLQAHSRGWVRAASTDPLDPPDIFPNYLSDDRDVDEMYRAIRILEDVVETEAYQSLGASIVRLQLPGCPAYEADREGYWRCYVRHMTYSVYHAAGTCSLGGVLDARLRVRGAARLRVADLSALPAVPRGNTAAAAIAIGERAADFLLEDEDSDSEYEELV